MAIVSKTVQAEQLILDQLIASTKQELDEKPEYKTGIARLKEIEKYLATHLYNKEKHDDAMAHATRIEHALIQHKELQEQQLFQAQRTQQINELCFQLKKLKKNIQQLDAQTTAEQEIVNKEAALTGAKQKIDTETRALAQAKELLLQEKGSLENQKEKLEQIKQEQLHHQKELGVCAQTIDDYQAIAQATGKDGIQALLIEDTIPEIEHEANQLLAKLTDNQTQLFIESLRDLKKGGTKETLDIKISDSAGIRPYELFSGGEAFRIDFALRIAISKLLARRAGTSLQTLIIDEGFGSQDEEGLSHIMDAIYKIQEDFAKVIIVSHLSSMKNQFPVHFVIEKGPHGSVVQIMEQG